MDREEYENASDIDSESGIEYESSSSDEDNENNFAGEEDVYSRIVNEINTAIINEGDVKLGRVKTILSRLIGKYKPDAAKRILEYAQMHQEIDDITVLKFLGISNKDRAKPRKIEVDIDPKIQLQSLLFDRIIQNRDDIIQEGDNQNFTTLKRVFRETVGASPANLDTLIPEIKFGLTISTLQTFLNTHLYFFQGKYYGPGEVLNVGYTPYFAKKQKAPARKRGLNPQAILRKHARKEKFVDTDTILKCAGRNCPVGYLCNTETGKCVKATDDGHPVNEYKYISKIPDYTLDTEYGIFGSESNVLSHRELWESGKNASESVEESVSKPKENEWEYDTKFQERMTKPIVYSQFGLRTKAKSELVAVDYKHKILDKALMYAGYDDYMVVKTNRGLKLVEHHSIKGGSDINGKTLSYKGVNYVATVKGKGLTLSETVSKAEVKLNRGSIYFYDTIPYVFTIVKKKPVLLPYLQRTEIISEDTFPPPVPPNYKPFGKSEFVVSPGRERKVYVGTKKVEISTLQTEEYLFLPVTSQIRRIVKRALFNHLEAVIPDVYAETLTKRAEKLKRAINWSVLAAPFQDWNVYVAHQFQSYINHEQYPRLLREAPDFTEEARKRYERLISPSILSDWLLASLQQHAFQSTGEEFLEAVRDTEDACIQAMADNDDEEDPIGYHKYEWGFVPYLRAICVHLRKEFGRPGVNIQRYRGKDLIAMISLSINRFISYKTFTVESIAEQMKMEWVAQELSNYVPAKDEWTRYVDTYGSTITALYKEYADTYERNLEQKRILDNMLEPDPVRVPDSYSTKEILAASLSDGRKFTERGMRLAEDCDALEEKLYNELAVIKENVEMKKYLRKVVEIIMCSDPGDPLGRFCKFFQSKIAKGMYSVRNLSEMTLFHAFPELLLNQKIKTSPDYAKLTKAFAEEIRIRMLNFIDSYLCDSPGVRVTNFPWIKYVDAPIELCKNTLQIIDKRLRGLEDVENYDCDENGNYDAKNRPMYTCVAKKEKVPLENIVIMYDDKTDSFVCNSIRNVLFDIAKGDVSKYSESFIQRMKDRYDIDTIKRAVLSFEATQDEALFGVNLPDSPPKLKKDSPIKKKRENVEETNAKTLAEAFKGKKKGQLLIILFKPDYIQLDPILSDVHKHVSPDKMKFIVETADNDVVSDLETNILKSKSFKERPAWIVYKSKNDKPKVVYASKINSKNTYQIMFKRLIEKV